MWGSNLDSIDDVIKVFVNYLKFQNPVNRLPWINESLGEETQIIKKQLIKLNTLGVCTINSQPRVNGALSTDPIFGWGPAGGFVWQKAYIEFFCSPEVWQKLYECLKSSQTLSFMAVNRKVSLLCNDDSWYFSLYMDHAMCMLIHRGQSCMSTVMQHIRFHSILQSH